MGRAVYTKEQDEARKRLYLPEGFTCDQLKERYAMLMAEAPDDQMDRINDDFQLLLACCV